MWTKRESFCMCSLLLMPKLMNARTASVSTIPGIIWGNQFGSWKSWLVWQKCVSVHLFINVTQHVIQKNILECFNTIKNDTKCLNVNVASHNAEIYLHWIFCLSKHILRISMWKFLFCDKWFSTWTVWRMSLYELDPKPFHRVYITSESSHHSEARHRYFILDL